MPELPFETGALFVSADSEFDSEPNDQERCHEDGRNRDRRVGLVVRRYAQSEQRQPEAAQPFIDARMMPVNHAGTSTSLGAAAAAVTSPIELPFRNHRFAAADAGSRSLAASASTFRITSDP
jgi:hypothetical protein